MLTLTDLLTSAEALQDHVHQLSTVLDDMVSALRRGESPDSQSLSYVWNGAPLDDISLPARFDTFELKARDFEDKAEGLLSDLRDMDDAEQEIRRKREELRAKMAEMGLES